MKITIITVNYNNKIGLKKTIDSVLTQNLNLIEYIVIDGGSTDGSKEILENNVKINYWVSEKDNGIYHAMNKGIEIATGDYLLFLNSGDVLFNENTIKNVIPIFSSRKSLYYGDIITEKNSELLYKWDHPNQLSLLYFLAYSLPHQATFIKRELIKNARYNENYRIISDWVFTVNSIIKEKESYEKINEVISIYNFEGISSNLDNYNLVFEEKVSYLSENFNITKEELSFYLEILKKSNSLNNKRFVQILDISKSHFHFEFLKIISKFLYRILPKKHKSNLPYKPNFNFNINIVKHK